MRCCPRTSQRGSMSDPCRRAAVRCALPFLVALGILSGCLGSSTRGSAGDAKGAARPRRFRRNCSSTWESPFSTSPVRAWTAIPTLPCSGTTKCSEPSATTCRMSLASISRRRDVGCRSGHPTAECRHRRDGDGHHHPFRRRVADFSCQGDGRPGRRVVRQRIPGCRGIRRLWSWRGVRGPRSHLPTWRWRRTCEPVSAS